MAEYGSRRTPPPQAVPVAENGLQNRAGVEKKETGSHAATSLDVVCELRMKGLSDASLSNSVLSYLKNFVTICHATLSR